MTEEEAIKVFRSYKIWDLMDNFTTDELQEMIDAVISAPSLPSNLDNNADLRKGFKEGYEQAMKDAEERIRNWERDFDDHYLTFDNCGYARIMQTDLEEDMIKVINGEDV